jgi:hypothetical protein
MAREACEQEKFWVFSFTGAACLCLLARSLLLLLLNTVLILQYFCEEHDARDFR